LHKNIINRACVFAHYDRDNIVDEYVYFYLKELKKIIQNIVFVTVSDIGQNDISRLKKLGINIITRDNIGYDFYSYKVGFEFLDLNCYDEIIICNDSVFGPLIPLEEIFGKMINCQCDFWGITESHLINYHLQSYFIVFKKNVINSKIFTSFWKSIEVIEDKEMLIQKYEVGLTQMLMNHNFVPKSLVDSNIPIKNIYKSYLRDISQKRFKILRIIKFILTLRIFVRKIKKKYNISIGFWDFIIINKNMPFIKKSLFITDPNKKIHIMKYKRLEHKFTKYPIKLINEYIARYE